MSFLSPLIKYIGCIGRNGRNANEFRNAEDGEDGGNGGNGGAGTDGGRGGDGGTISIYVKDDESYLLMLINGAENPGPKIKGGIGGFPGRHGAVGLGGRPGKGGKVLNDQQVFRNLSFTFKLIFLFQILICYRSRMRVHKN